MRAGIQGPGSARLRPGANRKQLVGLREYGDDGELRTGAYRPRAVVWVHADRLEAYLGGLPKAAHGGPCAFRPGDGKVVSAIKGRLTGGLGQHRGSGGEVARDECGSAVRWRGR